MAVLGKGEKTKRKIFVTAMNLFKEKGYDNVTVDEIVAEANIAKGTFYIYFPTKAHVVAEVFMEFDYCYEESMVKLQDIESSLGQVECLLNDSLEIQKDYVGFDLSVIGYRSQLELHTDYSMDADRTFYKYLTDVIRRGQENGEINRDASPEYYTKILIRCLRGAIYEWCMSRNKYDIGEDGEEYIKHLLTMLKL